MPESSPHELEELIVKGTASACEVVRYAIVSAQRRRSVDMITLSGCHGRCDDGSGQDMIHHPAVRWPCWQGYLPCA